ncbi:hypothetical protein [Actinomadura nitritigenes]|uniref:hypothetical protein n=1 Tax=Actinomadura nitritigenes TaxID=134602 RepID=UPI003D90B0EC
MAMTNGEAQAVMQLVRWSLNLWHRPVWRVPSPEKAKIDAIWLVDRAHGVLGAGLNAADVRAAWPKQSPGAAATDLAFVREAVGRWEAGEVPPQDTLTAIRDRLAGEEDRCTS